MPYVQRKDVERLKVIAVANQKGGVAKTTTTHNLGVALSQMGKKVLLIDLDSQASLTISVGIEPLDIERTIVNVLQKEGTPIKQCILVLEENLHIVTSVIDLAQMEMEMLSRVSREMILARALRSIKDEYDYILIDCPPQLSILTINALSCADGVLVPVKTEYLAYRGLKSLVETIDGVQTLVNPDLKIIGMLATIYDSRIKQDQIVLNDIKENYHLIGTVKMLSAAKKGVYEGLSALEQDPKSPVSVAYMELASKIISGEYESEEA